MFNIRAFIESEVSSLGIDENDQPCSTGLALLHFVAHPTVFALLNCLLPVVLYNDVLFTVVPLCCWHKIAVNHINKINY